MGYYILKCYDISLAPETVFSALSDERGCFFLDSSLSSGSLAGDFSFLGNSPYLILKGEDKKFLSLVDEEITVHHLKPNSNLPFISGAVGYMSYEFGLGFLPKPITRNNSLIPVSGSQFSFYSTIFAFDHRRKKIIICSNGAPEKNTAFAKTLAKENFKKAEDLLLKLVNKKHPSKNKNKTKTPTSLSFSVGRLDYLEAINKAKEYIRQGEIYQVNLSHQVSGVCNIASPALYLRLREKNPSAFGAYFDAGDYQIISSSPECFLTLRGNKVTTRPMKGTRPRSENLIKDRKNKLELLESKKDKAELLMILDLERNDLGRVCKYGTVKVKKMRKIESYKNVFQTTATIEGVLHPKKTRTELLRACFPGGSITGCPKIRAMEVISELELRGRGVYTGALGYLSFCGNMDFNILIRSMLKKGKRISFGIGGGVVADSTARAEYEETLVKAKGMMQALGVNIRDTFCPSRAHRRTFRLRRV